MTTRIDARFAELKQQGRSAFVTFVMAGDPDAKTSLDILKALPKAGADVIVPWQALRCVSRWTGKADKGVAKWRAAASAAAKQSRRPWIPEITDLAATIDVRARCADVVAQGGVVAVLHDLNLAARFCDALVLLGPGGLVAEGAPEAVLTPEHLERAFGLAAEVHPDPITGTPMVIPAHCPEERLA